MSSTDRQSRLLATEDWKTIYQSFRNADFQSYDFDNLRRTMINYLRQNYPEDFNDYIESSEYLALIDLIAFLGQNLSFRIDLNARENFLETAERRESVLRLARLISYNPARNLAANGLLKFETISTSESVFDSTGFNLSGTVVKWNDKANSNYFEQFIKIINAALPLGNYIGSPTNSEVISGVSTDQYRFNAANTDVPVFAFSRPVEGINTRFEIVSTKIENGIISEEPPVPGNSPAFLYRDDGQGAASSNTGFFMHFRQGKLNTGNFSVTSPTPNQVVSIDTTNINNSDIWLYGVDSNGVETTYWKKIDSVEGNNVIYNSLFENEKNLYAVTSRVDDRINLVFADGVFGNLPSGNFKIYYRVSSNANSVISPNSMQGISIQIPYLSKNNTKETLTIGLSLKSTVSNGRPSETTEDIKINAPATYYTQNRLITAEDYNIGPLGISQDIIKTKSVNRVSSGISRFYDLKDPSGKYSNTSLFSDDGVLYKQEFSEIVKFTFRTQSDIEGIIYNTIEPILESVNTRNFYENKFTHVDVADLSPVWTQVTSQVNRSTGTLNDSTDTPFYVGSFTSNSLKYIEPGALCKFSAPTGYYFTDDGEITADPTAKNASVYKWSMVQYVNESGTDIDVNGFGPIYFNDKIPSGAVLIKIIPVLARVLTNDIKSQLIDRTFAYKDFGLRYDQNDRMWKIITAENINTVKDFSLGKSGNSNGDNQDSSWLLYFKTDGEKYTVTYRNLRYVFESANNIRFFFDNADKIYDPKQGKVLKDNVRILSINTMPNSSEPFNRDFDWSITDAYKDAEGYIDTRKIQLSFFDYDDDGIPDDPELFKNIINDDQLIFQKKYISADGVEDFKYFDNSAGSIKILQNQQVVIVISQEVDGQIFYYRDENIFKVLSKTNNNMKITSEYKAYQGRDNLKFHYEHVSSSDYRIDPASSNIIDTYVLTKNYDLQMRRYLNGGISTMPLPASSDELFRSYGTQISKLKSISDEVVYHPVKYKMLFGSKAKNDLQVTFKVVKNPGISINDNEVKSNVISAINRFFSIENWNFGDTFYFQELSAYIMNSMSPDIVSIVIVPRSGEQAFGSLFEIKSEPDEIFISAAEVSDVEIINELTATNLQASGNVITSVSSTNSGVQSS